MARNPYQMDPFLAQGFSNLTKALIGDPETDYQVSRTNRVNTLLPYEQAQLKAATAKDTSESNKFDAETADILKLATDLQLLSENSFLANAATAPFNLPLDETTGLPQQIDPEAASALLRYSLSGGDPDDRVNAMSTMGEARALNAARRAILTGSDEQAGRGALLLAPTGGQFQNPAFAQNQLDNLYNIANLESKDDLAGEKNEDALRFAPGGQGDRTDTAQANAITDAAKIDAAAKKEFESAKATILAQKDVDIAKIEDTFKREELKKNQARLKDENVFKQYITVNDEMIVSAELAKKLDIKPNADGKYTMSFGNTEDMIEVEIENKGGTPTKVNIAPQNIEKLNPININGKLVIPDGHNFNAATPKENRENFNKFNKSFETDAKNYSALGELPGSAIAKIRDIAYENLEADMADGETYDVAYRQSVLPILQSPNIKVGGGFFGGGGFTFPEYFYNATRNNPVALKSVATSMGYSNEQAEALVNYQN